MTPNATSTTTTIVGQVPICASGTKSLPFSITLVTVVESTSLSLPPPLSLSRSCALQLHSVNVSLSVNCVRVLQLSFLLPGFDSRDFGELNLRQKGHRNTVRSRLRPQCAAYVTISTQISRGTIIGHRKNASTKIKKNTKNFSIG